MSGGITYFPLDVHMDDSLELIEAEFGLTGFAVIVKIYQKIYGNQGYYCEWTKDVALLFSKKEGCSAVSEIVAAAIRRRIFDEGLFKKYQILTSEGIQKRYFEIVSRRKEVKVKKEYLLVEPTPKYKNVNISAENVDISKRNADNSEQRKVKESKVKESKVKHIICAVISHLNDAIGTNYKFDTSQTVRLITARVNEGYSENDFKVVIDKKVKEWKGTDMERYLRPETLFGNKFEGYLNSKEGTKGKFGNYSCTTNYDYSTLESAGIFKEEKK